MSITITITIPGPTTLPRIPGPRPAEGATTRNGTAPTRAELLWVTVRPYLPVLLAGAESLVPGLGVVVALAGMVAVRANTDQVEEPDDDEHERRAA
jgi:hypothetical protein